MGRSLLLIIGLCAPLAAQIQQDLDKDLAARLERISPQEIERTVRDLVAFGTRHTLSETESATRGIGAARRYLERRFKELVPLSEGRMQVGMERFQVPPGRRLPEGAEVVNVYALLPGTDPDRWVIMSGHYDSRASEAMDAKSDAPGADDDASGTAVVLEAARVLADVQPRANLLFLCVAGEEQGLLGAHAHAERAANEGRNIEAMITNDIVGGVRGTNGQQEPMRVRLFSEGVPSGPKDERGNVRRGIVGSDNDAPSRQLARYLKARGEAYVDGFEVTLIFRQDRFLRGGDHRAFNDFGFAGVRFTEVHENWDWQHNDLREKDGVQYGDRPEHLDYEFVARIARINAAGATELARAPGRPRQVRVMVDKLTPHTELRWAKSPAEDLGGYAVLYRRTHEPTWTHRRVVAAEATSVVMEKLSKDDWLFAVEAFDQAGRRSLPVYPTPSYGRRR